mmetsp:Transcript_70546/g.168452  ORF Transcript_70546/g.168452 Transcript_70546/m.168452 type:complete len:297 (-) Transcript_70546:416-1306(-)
MERLGRMERLLLHLRRRREAPPADHPGVSRERREVLWRREHLGDRTLQHAKLRGRVRGRAVGPVGALVRLLRQLPAVLQDSAPGASAEPEPLRHLGHRRAGRLRGLQCHELGPGRMPAGPGCAAGRVGGLERLQLQLQRGAHALPHRATIRSRPGKAAARGALGGGAALQPGHRRAGAPALQPARRGPAAGELLGVGGLEPLHRQLRRRLPGAVAYHHLSSAEGRAAAGRAHGAGGAVRLDQLPAAQRLRGLRDGGLDRLGRLQGGPTLPDAHGAAAPQLLRPAVPTRGHEGGDSL